MPRQSENDQDHMIYFIVGLGIIVVSRGGNGELILASYRDIRVPK